MTFLAGAMALWLTQQRCVDGGQPVYLNCPSNAYTLQLEHYPEHFRKTDWGAGGVPYYQMSDAVMRDSGVVMQTFAYAPFGHANNGNGDGADWIMMDGVGNAWIYASQNPGSPPVYFSGPECGNAGWVLSRPDTPVGGFASYVGAISTGAYYGQCPPAAASLTRYGYLLTSFPLKHNGALLGTYVQYALIVEHYNQPTAAASWQLERFFYTPYLGKIAWMSWVKPGVNGQPGPVGRDLDQRCPEFTWQGPVGTSLNGPTDIDSGWELNDCRVWTDLVDTSGNGSILDLGFPAP